MAKKADPKDTAKTTAKKAAEKAVSKMDSKKDAKKGGVKKYYKDLKSEIKKVVWPSAEKVRNNTGVVLAVMAICALLLGGIDTLLNIAVDALLKIGG